MRSTVEGLCAARAAGRNDADRRRVHIPKHLGRRDMQDGKPALPQELVPRFIALRSVPHVMRDTVDLDRQLRRRTVEIEHIGSARMLLADFDVCTAQPLPQQHFGQR